MPVSSCVTSPEEIRSNQAAGSTVQPSARFGWITAHIFLAAAAVSGRSAAIFCRASASGANCKRSTHCLKSASYKRRTPSACVGVPARAEIRVPASTDRSKSESLMPRSYPPAAR